MHEYAQVQGLAGALTVGQLALDVRGVVGDQALQLLRDVKPDADRERNHRDAGGDAQSALSRTEGLDALGHPSAREREDQQRHGQAVAQLDARRLRAAGQEDDGQHRQDAR